MTAALICFGVLTLSAWVVVTMDGAETTVIYRFALNCPRCGMTVTRATHGGLYELRCHSECGFEGTVAATEVQP